MDCLKSKFDSLKQKIEKEKNNDEKLRSEVKVALNSIFCPTGIGDGAICDLHLKNGNLVLKAKNKTIANELFLRKTQIKNILEANKKIKEVVIR